MTNPTNVKQLIETPNEYSEPPSRPNMLYGICIPYNSRVYNKKIMNDIERYKLLHKDNEFNIILVNAFPTNEKISCISGIITFAVGYVNTEGNHFNLEALELCIQYFNHLEYDVYYYEKHNGCMVKRHSDHKMITRWFDSIFQANKKD